MPPETATGAFSLPYPCLCLVTDRRVCPPDELPARAAAAAAGGVDLVQLRDKELPGGVLRDQVRRLRAALPPNVLLVVNERADVAVAGGADGVQLGEAALLPTEARLILGAAAVIGRSVHSVAGALAAQREGADFLVVGTMFATPSHPGEEPSGPGLLERIAAAGVSVPLIAIGGITRRNVGETLRAGAHGAAVITSILAADDPRAAAQGLKDAMAEAVAGRQPAPVSILTTGPTDGPTTGSTGDGIRVSGGVSPP